MNPIFRTEINAWKLANTEWPLEIPVCSLPKVDIFHYELDIFRNLKIKIHF